MRNSIITQLEFKDGIYQGQTLQSRYKQGIGVYLWENGSAYFGEWKSDQIDGNGILFLPPKTTIQGQFNSAKLHGNSLIQTRQAKYYGKWLNGLPNGNMTAHFKQGEVTITFQDGKPTRGLSQREQSCEIPNLKTVQCYNSTALQTIDWLEGTFYGVTGKNAANKVAPNGLGVFVPKNGLFQCGQFKDGVLNGLGRLQQPSGEVYQGFFENGKYHGRGIYLFKEDELQWAKGLWRFGELIEIFQNGLVKNCIAPKDLMFPYSDHKNPIQIKQPITLNNIKEIEDLFEIQFQRQEPIIQKQTNASPSPEQKSKLSNYKYFQNSTTNSYKRISEALHGSKQHSSPERNSIQLINYYKGQLRDLDQNEQTQHKKSNKPQQKSRKSHSNSQQYLIQSSRQKDPAHNKSSSKLSQSAYMEEIKKLQTQFIKPLDQNKSVQSQQSQIYQAILDSEEHSSQRSEQFQGKQPSSSKDHIDQIIRKSKQYQKEQSVEQSRKSLMDQSRQSYQSKQAKSPQHLQQSKTSQQSKCKSSEGSKKLVQQHNVEDQNKTKSEGNKFHNEGNQQTEQVPLDTSQQSQQLWESRQIKEFSQPRDSKRSKQSSQPVSQRISIKSVNQVASQQITPQQSHREQQDQNKQSQLQQQEIQEELSQIQKSQQQNQTQQQIRQQEDNDHSKKLSFCQQDFALDMRNTAIFNQVESNQSSQMKFHKHKRSQSQTDFDKFDINDDPQMKLIKQQQLYMQQLIEQQQRELELLKTQQQQLEDENQISQSRPGQKTNASIDSYESYPYQHSESFQQEFIKSVSDVLKSELKKKQEDSFIVDNNNNSPHFEQSQIANNQQQSMLFNDIQSLENVNVDERLHNRRSSQQQEDGKKSRGDSLNIKKQPVSHSELDDLQIDKIQDAQSRQSRQSRRSGYSGENKQQRSQSHQSSQRNYSNQQNSFNQYQSQEQFYSQKQQAIIQEKVDPEGHFQQTKFEQINTYKKQDHLSFDDNKQDQSQSSQQISIISNQLPQEQIYMKKINQEDSIVKKQQLNQQDNNILKQKQQNTVQKRQDKLLSRNEESIEELMKKQSQKQIPLTQLKFVACPSQHSLPGQMSFCDKQFQIKPDQMSENIQVTIVDDQSDTQQNIQEIKLQLAAQKEILSQLYHSIQESRQMKVSQFDSDKRTSEQRTVKRGIPNGVVDPCSSPIKKVIITKGAFPAFTIIKSLSPIRL
ncbi:unnamed protein product [Paramecium octaurelia]|uniref:MORN repeat-containing protein n=1 Tax=Paramecium octaurelia TaxID=43137 RepID=A0A8S1S6J5_PAROT|nr:unnamed protein product [Paramecium octaurelia]